RREAEIGSDTMRQVERRVILSVVDRIWREHLYEMDHLRDGIGLRAVGQRDPLVEYQREAYEAFAEMMAHIKEEATGYFFNLPVAPPEAEPEREPERSAAGNGRASREEAKVARPRLREQPRGPAPSQLSYTSSAAASGSSRGGSGYAVGGDATTAAGASAQRQADAAAPPQQTVRNEDKVGRNDPCPCGSGLKYKRCHGA
ncbi:MAG: SEC-C domain-containing protein, partial [Euzebyaceae bacterium]|nr:SEC-C domain-containing protein [Euzebyaceae bacterium]